jgi:hypothetical protein
MTHYWVNHPEKRWIKMAFGILFTIIALLAFLGVLAAIGILPAHP